MGIRIKGPIWKTGNSYVVTVPKSLIESGNFALGQNVQGELEAITDTNVPRRIWYAPLPSFAIVA